MTIRILTGRTYTNDGTAQVFDVVSEKVDGNAVRLDYVDRDGYKGHVIFENGTVYAPNILAGHYYPTEYQIEVA